MRTLRIWLAFCCSVALVVSLGARVAVAQVAPGNLFDTSGFADATGGAGGSARGGDGGNGGAGTAPVCNQSSTDADVDPEVLCGAGGLGGDAGKAGESDGGNGGIAFTVGGSPPPSQPAPNIQQLLADLFVRQAHGSFIITLGNNGPDPAQGVQFSTNIKAVSGFPEFGGISAPEGLSCSSSLQPGTPFNPEDPPFSVTCTVVGDLAPGQTIEFTIHWDPGECGTAEVMSSAQITAASPADPNLSNNSSVLNVTEKDPSPSCEG